MDCSSMYDHFQKMQQLAQGERKIELTADIRCMRTSGKLSCSVCPIVDLLLYTNVWKRGIAWGKNIPQQKCTHIPCILLLYLERAIMQRLPYTSQRKVTVVLPNICEKNNACVPQLSYTCRHLMMNAQVY